MKKVLALATVLILHSSLFILHSNAQDVKNEEEFKDVSTDQEILDDRKPIFEKPADDSNKDLKYWAKEVGSRLKVTGYAQGGYSATIAEGSANRNTFDVKRVILMVGVDIAPKFYAFFMHDFKSGSMQEYYMEYRHSKAFNVRLGQSKREFTVENPLSPTILESIAPMTQGVVWLNGSDPLQSNGSGRDAGLMIYGKVGKFGYFAELLNGAPINTADRNNQKDVVLKLEYYPVPNFKLSISGVKGYGHAENDSPYNESVKKGDNYRKNRYAGGFDWKLKKTGTDYNANRCVTIRSEVMGGKDDDEEGEETFVIKHAMSRKKRARRRLYYRLNDDNLPEQCSKPDTQSRKTKQGATPEAVGTVAIAPEVKWEAFNHDYLIFHEKNGKAGKCPWEWNLAKLFREAFENHTQRPYGQVMGAALRLSKIQDKNYYYERYKEACRAGIIVEFKHPEKGDTWVELKTEGLPF